MFFTITCLDPKTKETSKYVFDNQTSEVFDEEGDLVDFSLLEGLGNYPRPKAPSFQIFSADKPLTKKGRLIRKLRIQLGMACNYNCKYCLQAAFRSSLDKVPGPQGVDAFLEKIRSAGITLTPSAAIELWGGEPLVYWKTLRVLIPRLREEFGNAVTLSMITNGSLLTREMVDFFNAHQVQISISHDGPGFSLRDNEDPLFDKEVKDVWLYLLKTSTALGIPMSFVCVLSPKNNDLDKIRAFFDEHFSKNVVICFEGIVSYSGAQMQECAFDWQTSRTLDSSIFKAIVRQEGLWPTLDDMARSLMQRLVHRIPASEIPGRCDEMRTNTLTVSLDGKIGSCHNRPTSRWQIGSLDNYQQISNPNLTHWSLRPVCRNCFVISSCKGGCPHLSNEELAQCCSNEFVYHAAIFGAVWFLLTQKILIGVEPMQ